jgi:hypothetical protein
MALLTLRPMSTAGSAITYSSASASDTFPLDASGKTFVHIKNAGASSDTVTITTAGTVGPGLAIADLSFAVANGAEKFVGPLDPALYAVDGIATITHSYTTSVTVAVITC